MQTVEGLRNLGYKVRVTHVRNFFPFYVILTNSNGELYRETYHTRSEFEQFLSENRVHIDERYEDKYIFDKFTYGDCVNPRHGFTVLEITTPFGDNLRTKKSCNGKPFSRKNQVKNAMKRIFGDETQSSA